MTSPSWFQQTSHMILFSSSAKLVTPLGNIVKKGQNITQTRENNNGRMRKSSANKVREVVGGGADIPLQPMAAAAHGEPHTLEKVAIP